MQRMGHASLPILNPTKRSPVEKGDWHFPAASNEYAAAYDNATSGYSQDNQEPTQSSTTYYDPVRDATHNV